MKFWKAKQLPRTTKLINGKLKTKTRSLKPILPLDHQAASRLSSAHADKASQSANPGTFLIDLLASPDPTAVPAEDGSQRVSKVGQKLFLFQHPEPVDEHTLQGSVSQRKSSLGGHGGRGEQGKVREVWGNSRCNSFFEVGFLGPFKGLMCLINVHERQGVKCFPTYLHREFFLKKILYGQGFIVSKLI